MRHLSCLAGLLAGLVPFSLPAVAIAQPLNIAELRSEYLPPTKLAGERPVGTTPWSDAEDVQVSTYGASLTVPLSLGESTVFAPGFGYRLDKLSFSHESPAERELDLHALELPLTLIHLLSSDWMLLLQAKPGIASDLEAVEGRALRTQGMALASYQFSEQLVLGGGGAATFEYGSFLPLPVLYVNWQPTASISVDALLPVQAEAKWRASDRIELGLRADVDGSSYSIGDSAIRDVWPCAAQSDDLSTPDDEAQPSSAQCIDHIGYSVATAGASVGVRTVDSVWLSVYAGHTLFRRFEQMNADNERVAGGTQTLPDVFFARVDLTWRLPDDDE